MIFLPDSPASHCNRSIRGSKRKDLEGLWETTGSGWGQLEGKRKEKEGKGRIWKTMEGAERGPGPSGAVALGAYGESAGNDIATP